MRSFGLAMAAAVLGVVIAGVGLPTARADLDFALNGTFRAVSGGDWAKTNDVYMDEQTVVQNWTIRSSCTTAHDCTGAVTSSQGWTVPLRYRINVWTIAVERPNWQPCPDGTSVTGTQRFNFQGIDHNGQLDVKNIDRLAGTDTTRAPSGSCGRNAGTSIQMPLTVTRI